MKYLKLFVTIVVLTAFVVSFSLAGRANDAASTYGVVKGDVKVFDTAAKNQMKSMLSKSNNRVEMSKDESDVPAQFKSKSSNMPKSVSSSMRAFASPTPHKQVSALGPLHGLYHIPGDFPSLGVAVATLNFVGDSADVVFQLDNASYTEPGAITFGSYPGNADYNVLVTPKAGVAVTFNFIANDLDGKGFAFNGASNVTIDGVGSGGTSLSLKYSPLSVFPMSDAFGSTIYITGGSYMITVANASVEGIVNNAVWADQTEGRSGVFVFGGAADPAYNESIVLDNLTITNATYGIKDLPEVLDISVVDLTVTNCKIGGAYGNPVAIGGWYEYPAIMNFSNNIIDGVTFLSNYWDNAYTEYDVDVAFGVGPIMYNLGQSTGSHMLGMDAGVVSNNILRNVGTSSVAGAGILTYGARVSQGNNGLNIAAVTKNNLIYNISNPGGGTASITGLRGTAGHVYHNSIRLTGAITGASFTARCINGVTDAYNNAFSNELTGGTASNRTGIVAGGTYDYNAVYAADGRSVSGQATDAAAIAAGVNIHGTFGPVGFNSDLTITTGPSSAEDAGKSHIPVLVDFTGAPVDTTDAGVRDDGAYQFSTGTPVGTDLLVGAFSAPPAGVPEGVGQAPKLTVKNNSNVAITSFDVTVTVSDGYSQLLNVASLAPFATQVLTFPLWTPASAGSYTFNASASVAGDVNVGNDNAPAYTISVSSPKIITDTTYKWTSGDEGWTRSIDWVRNSTFTKLGGPRDGAAMVTQRPNLIATYTEGAYASTQGYSAAYPGANILLSEWFNFSTMAGTDSLYLSFYQTLAVEGAWDRSWWEYTTDGATWNHIGVQDDPNGLNWYNTALYANAAMDRANFDSATAIQYGLWTTPAPTIFPTWTSNNDNASPSGWVYSQLLMRSADYPTRSTHIRFRFIAFSDASTAPNPGGWAIDNVRFAPTANPLAGAFHGQVFADLDGDGIFNNADTPFGSTKVYLGRFGSWIDSTTTDGSGMYSFPTQANLPASYSIKPNLTGYSYTTPSSAATTGIAIVNHPANGSDIEVSFGAYVGSVSGKVVSDVNDNGVNDSEPGLSGYVVKVYKDLVTGTFMDSTTTDVNGNWTMKLPAYATYVAKLVAKTTSRQTLPASNGTITFAIAGTSGGGTAVVTGQDFGVFVFATITVKALVDLNGNGVVDGDVTGLPAGATAIYTIYKGVTPVASNVNIGNGTLSQTYINLDIGTYYVEYTSTPTGWITTNGSLTHATITVSTSGQVVTDIFLSFKLVHISGYAFLDANGDGLSAGDAAAEGRTITITGNLGSSVVLDATGLFEFIVGPGAHTLSQSSPTAAWVSSKPLTNGGTYVYTSFSGSVAGQDKVNQDFGSFETYTASGTVFHDYNNDGIMNGSDDGFSNVDVALTSATTQQSASNGTFSFTGLQSPGAKTLSITVPTGYALSSTPTTYSWTTASGVSHTGLLFGLYKTSSTGLKYRTFTLDSLQAWATLKSVARPKTGAVMPNVQNMYDEIFKQAKDSAQATGIIVGEAGVKVDPSNAKSKFKAYLKPSKGSDINATFYKKVKTGVLNQTGTARGIDFLTGNVARVLGLNTKLTPDKFSDVLLGNMLALSINMAASDWGKTPAGFGDLVYSGAGTYHNMTVADIAAAGNEIMTAWEGVTSSTYSELNTAVAAINGAFSGALDTATSWTKTSKLVWTGVSAVTANTVLHVGTSVTPRTRVAETWEAEPTTFTLAQNYPNPFNPSTTISFSLPEDAVVTIKVFNMLGQEIATVVDNSSYFSGTYNETFDAKNLTSGVYFYRVTADMTNSETGAVQHMTQTKKMLLTK